MKSKLKSPSHYSTDIHKKIIKDLLKKGSVYSYYGLCRSIQEAASQYLKIGVGKSKLFLKFYVTQKIIEKRDAGYYVVTEN